MPADRSEATGDGVPEDAPRVLDRTEPVSGPEPVTDTELVEQGQRVREQLVRGDGVAGELVAVDEQHPPTRARHDRGDCCARTPGADDDRVIAGLRRRHVHHFLPAGCGTTVPTGRGRSVEAAWGITGRRPPASGQAHRACGRPPGPDATAPPPPGGPRGRQPGAPTRPGPRPHARAGGGCRHPQGSLGCRVSRRRVSAGRGHGGPPQLDRCEGAAPVLARREDLVAPVEVGRGLPGALGSEQLRQPGPGSELGRHLRPLSPEGQGPLQGFERSVTVAEDDLRLGQPAEVRRRVVQVAGGLVGRDRRGPGVGGLLPPAVEQQKHPARTGVGRQTVRRGPCVVDLAQGSQRESEVVDDRVVGLDERRQPWLAQAASAPRPGGGGGEEVDVEEHRGRVDR